MLTSEYQQALRTYLEQQDATALLRAYEIGRGFIQEPLGVSALVTAHHRSLRASIPPTLDAGQVLGLLDHAEEFLRQAVASFETVRQGFQEAAETTSAVARFTGILCHEIRTPLTSVIASAGLLQEILGPELAEMEGNLLANVLEGGNRIKRRTSELMDLVGFQAGTIALDRREVDTRAMVDGIVQRLMPVARAARVALELEFLADTPVTSQLDSERFEQVITNLVMNAIKFGSAGGRVELCVGGPDALSVEVRDYGKGIPAHAQPNLFRPFYCVGSPGNHVSGLGLGLALCSEIVTAHGGRMSIESEPGNGTVVRFIIPSHGNKSVKAS